MQDTSVASNTTDGPHLLPVTEWIPYVEAYESDKKDDKGYQPNDVDELDKYWGDTI